MEIRKCKPSFLISLLCMVNIAGLIFNSLNLSSETFFVETGHEIIVEKEPRHNSKDSTAIRSFIGNRWEANGKCLSFEKGVDNIDSLISGSKQIFIVIPPKAGGSSIKQFTYTCMNSPNLRNWINKPIKAKENLMRKYKMDRVIASHFNKDTLIDLSEHTSRGTLIIYMHREGTDRLLSAIHQIAEDLCLFRFDGMSQNRNNRINRMKTTVGSPINTTDHIFATPRNETHCVLNEGPFIDIIERKVNEISNGPDDVLTCEAYEAIEQNLPNFVFLHYKQQNKLQSLLAKHYCPDQEEKHIMENVSSAKKRRQLLIQLENDKTKVSPVSEWVREKGDMIEWSLKLKGKGCQYKTRRIEDALFACEDEVYQISEP